MEPTTQEQINKLKQEAVDKAKQEVLEAYREELGLDELEVDSPDEGDII